MSENTASRQGVHSGLPRSFFFPLPRILFPVCVEQEAIDMPIIFFPFDTSSRVMVKILRCFTANIFNELVVTSLTKEACILQKLIGILTKHAMLPNLAYLLCMLISLSC